MHGFEYFVPTEIVFGAGSTEKLPELLKKRGLSRVLVVYGSSSAKKSGLLDRVFRLLDEAGVQYRALGGVQPNPRAALAREGVQLALESGAELILAVGGGSVIDTVDALREAGAEVLGVVSIFTYGMQKGLEKLAAANVKNVSLTDLDTIARVGAEGKYITEGDVARLLAFRANPSDESWIKGGNN